MDYFVHSLLVCLPSFSGSLKWTQVAKLSLDKTFRFAFGWDCRQLRERNKDITAAARREWRRNVACVCQERGGHIIDCRAPRTHKGGRSLAETSQTITCLGFIKTRTQIEPPAGLRLKDWQLILLANGETSTKEPVGGSRGFSPAEALIALQAATWHSENTGDVWEDWSVGERKSKVLMMTEAQGLIYKYDTSVSQTVSVCIAAFKKMITSKSIVGAHVCMLHNSLNYYELNVL